MGNVSDVLADAVGSAIQTTLPNVYRVCKVSMPMLEFVFDVLTDAPYVLKMASVVFVFKDIKLIMRLALVIKFAYSHARLAQQLPAILVKLVT